ncbi:MAG: DCC1-like thiol-disulfide oxidoreductase family protein [Gammaproteobacteria bacterium]
MVRLISAYIIRSINQKVPATGIGLFRMFYGLVTLQEIIFLYYFNHLIFDPIPYIDVEFPTLPFFLGLWGVAAACVAVGYRYQTAVFWNYLFWIIFVNFTSMQRDFDGGFDMFMTGAGFFLLFMPGNRAFSLDRLRYKLSTPFTHYASHPKPTVSVLCYTLPTAICLGFLYFDSAIHKLFAEHWRNGLGAWLPSTQPYYVSAIDMSIWLNIEPLQKTIGYTILIFQFTFIFLFARPGLRVIYLIIGIGLHLGITLSLNIYPFGLGMLAFYTLIVPFSWWRSVAALVTARRPALTVFYDRLCPLCNRTVLILNHFDILKCIDFKSAQEHAGNFPALAAISPEVLLTDLYALDDQNRVYSGLDTYIQVFTKMRYLAPFGLLLGLPGLRRFAEARYRSIADSRLRVSCTAECLPVMAELEDDGLYHRFFEVAATAKPKAFARKLAKILIAILVLQINSSIHYGIFYRFKVDTYQNAVSAALTKGSNSLISVSQMFLGIAPHALYLHDHFEGYDRILAITYRDEEGREHWLPFVNEQGRLLAPNWGRVHSMWANIAVTPHIDAERIKKFIMKVTAFWGHKTGLNLDKAIFQIKLKKIESPTHWVHDQLHKNFAAPWSDVGSVQWRGKTLSVELPLNINEL